MSMEKQNIFILKTSFYVFPGRSLSPYIQISALYNIQQNIYFQWYSALKILVLQPWLFRTSSFSYISIITFFECALFTPLCRQVTKCPRDDVTYLSAMRMPPLKFKILHIKNSHAFYCVKFLNFTNCWKGNRLLEVQNICLATLWQSSKVRSWSRIK